MRRRTLWIALCIIMLLSVLPISSAFAAESYDVVRVKLSVGTPTSFSFYIDGNYSVEQDNAIPLDRQQYTVKVESGTLRLYFGSSRLYSGNTITLIQHAPTEGLNNFIYLNNTQHGYRRYLGDLVFTISDGSIQVVNRLYLEEYLYGVVPHEMSNSWPLEALKAQAVAARNYTVQKIKSTDPYDLTDLSSIDQVYKGYDPSTQRAIDAVNGTKGQVVQYNGATITAYYSASNGGYTDIPYHRWGGGADWQYYDIQPDPFDLANPSSCFESIFFPVAIDDTHPVTTSDNMTGSPNAALAIDYIRKAILDSGQLVVSGVTDISQFELTGVLDLYTHTYDTDNGQDHSLMPVTGVNNCVDKVKATGDFTVQLKPELGGAALTLSDVQLDLRYLNGDVSDTTYQAFASTKLGLLLAEPIYSGETLSGFNISQRRYGHGIGLSQRGAQQRSATQTYDQILSFYYPNTTLATLNVNKPTLTTHVTPSVANATVVSSTGYLNVRSGPSTSYSAIGRLPGGARIKVIQIDPAPGWLGINFGGSTAYVCRQDTDGTIYVNLDETLQSYTITTAVNNPSYGTVTGGGTYVDMTSIALRAVPNDGYQFVRWTQTGSQSAIYSLIVSENRTITAEFAAIGTPSLTADSGGYDDIQLSWTEVSGANGYEIYRATSKNGNYSLAYTADSDMLSYTDTGLDTNSTYYYKVRAVSTARTATTYGAFSGIESATPTLLVPYVVPTSISHTAIMTAWTEVSGAEGYEVWYATQKYGVYSLKYTVDSGAAGSWTRGGLITDKTYYFKARAFRTVDGENVYGEFSTIQSTAPGRPSMSVTATSPTSAAVTWITVTGSDGYEVWRSTQKYGTYSLKYTASASTSNWVNSGLTTDKAYYYKVRSYRLISGIKTYGLFSSTNSVIPSVDDGLASPYVVPNSTSYTAINISWTAVPGASGYEVWYATQKYGTYSLKHTAYSGAAGSWTRSGLTTDKTYYFKVRAFHTVDGERVYGGFSSIQSTAPGRPSMAVTRASSTSATIAWISIAGSDGYEVWRGTQKYGTYSLKYNASSSATSWTNGGLTTDKAYYYKVRTYRLENGTKVYSQFSSINSVVP